MYCKHCGKQIDDDAMFCSGCGRQVGEAKPSAPPMTSQSNFGAGAPYQRDSGTNGYTGRITMPASKPKKNNTLLYVILGIAALCLILAVVVGILAVGYFNGSIASPFGQSSSTSGYSSQGDTSQGGSSQDGSSQGDTSQGDTSQGGSSQGGSSQGGTSQDDASAVQNSDGSYTVTSIIDGRQLTAKAGYVDSLIQFRSDSPQQERAVVLPELESYSGGVFTIDREMSPDGERDALGGNNWLSRYYEFSGTTAEARSAMLGYIQMLQDDCGATLIGENSSEWALDLGDSYPGNTVRGLYLTGDLIITCYDYFYCFEYGHDIGFLDVGGSNDGNPPVAKRLTASCGEAVNGGYYFEAEDIHTGEYDYLRVWFGNGVTFSKGDVFTLADYQSEGVNGAGAYYALSMRCDAYITGAWASTNGIGGINNIGTEDEEGDCFREIRVEILDQTQDVTVIHYYVQAYSDYVTSQYEGLMVAQNAGQVQPSGNDSPDIDLDLFDDDDDEPYCGRCRGTGKVDCSYCVRGKIKCTDCGGDGWMESYGYGNSYDSGTDCRNCIAGWEKCWKCSGTSEMPCDSCR